MRFHWSGWLFDINVYDMSVLADGFLLISWACLVNTSIELPSASDRSLKLSVEPFRQSNDYQNSWLVTIELVILLTFFFDCMSMNLFSSVCISLNPHSDETRSGVIREASPSITSHNLFSSLLGRIFFSYTTKTSKKYYQSWIDDFHLSFLLLLILEQQKKKYRKKSSRQTKTKQQNNDKGEIFFVCCAEKRRNPKAENEPTHKSEPPAQRNFRSDFFYLANVFFCRSEIFSFLSCFALRWNFMHRVLDLRTIDVFRFGTPLLSQARYLLLDSRIETTLADCSMKLADPILDLHENLFLSTVVFLFLQHTNLSRSLILAFIVLAIILVERECTLSTADKYFHCNQNVFSSPRKLITMFPNRIFQRSSGRKKERETWACRNQK